MYKLENFRTPKTVRLVFAVCTETDVLIGMKTKQKNQNTDELITHHKIRKTL